MTIASLPMYDLPEIRAATDKWWERLAYAFRQEGIADVPDALWRGEDHRMPWTHPDLLLSQTCGYPLMHELREKVSLAATPCYSAEGCSGPNYCSVVIVHDDNPAAELSDLQGSCCAINNRNSQSGYNALRALVAPISSGGRFFSDVKVSGSHLNSIAMVHDGEADVAAVDCVTYALLKRHRPLALKAIRALCLTPHAPALPYVSRANAGSGFLQKIRRGLEVACSDAALADCRETLMIREFQFLEASTYKCIIEMEAAAIEHGYRDVA
jgi:ABC-type phosphate/phosphonate transport system substrate-binding protein